MPGDQRSWTELSWKELVDRLQELENKAGEAPGSDEGRARLVHELQVHQVELEMQNRELREAQTRLEASRARYTELFDRAPIGYATVDRNGLILEINLTAAAMLRRPRELLLQTPFGVAAGVRDRMAFLALLRTCTLDRGEHTADFEIDAGGIAKVLQVTATPNAGEGRDRVSHFVTMTDVTEKRRAEAEHAALEAERRAHAEADAANRTKDQFLGLVSHELRTPLHSILGWTQVLVARGSEPAILVQGLEAMQRNTRALARIVDDILDVSRIATGRLAIEKKRFDLEEAVRSALEPAKAAAVAKGIALRASLSPCPVDGDPVRLEQVASNLLSNAIKFTPKGGSVEVHLELRGDVVELGVRDDGSGIGAADLPHIFEEFKQADGSSTRDKPGLGLGLAIARHVVAAHGGTIEAHSEGRDRGALFTARLPRSSGAPPAAPAPVAAGRRAGAKDP
jgi:PAS domain S-box-containing protein